jgi:pilus assembly protein CpaB
VARFEIFPREPILQTKLIKSDQGYLSAVLAKGMRGVSISVLADSASGGFIVPNDHVDVVLTRGTAAGQLSETILSNVRVLAIGTRLGETGKTGATADGAAATDENGDPKSQVFADRAIATLELDPGQAETVVNAAQLGKLSLVLRSIVDFAANSNDQAKIMRNAPIRLIRYGHDGSITTGQSKTDTSSDAPEVAPAAYAPVVTLQTGPAAVATQPVAPALTTPDQ